MTILFNYRLLEAGSDAISRQAKGVIDGVKKLNGAAPIKKA
jgi:hypothetical protein